VARPERSGVPAAEAFVPSHRAREFGREQRTIDDAERRGRQMSEIAGGERDRRDVERFHLRFAPAPSDNRTERPHPGTNVPKRREPRAEPTSVRNVVGIDPLSPATESAAMRSFDHANARLAPAADVNTTPSRAERHEFAGKRIEASVAIDEQPVAIADRRQDAIGIEHPDIADDAEVVERILEGLPSRLRPPRRLRRRLS
jgi:hypothetical protein